MRQFVSCLVIALTFAVSANGMASAAISLGHQNNCIATLDASAAQAGADHGHGHHHDEPAQPQPASGHDHETCMMHACPALNVRAVRIQAQSDVFLAKLSWLEHASVQFERADSLKRPPKS